MPSYNNFIGIDIGKFQFVVAVHGSKETHEYENNAHGIKEFLRDHKVKLKHSLCVLEVTGGYEMELLLTLCQKDFAVHRADGRKVKNFIRSLGSGAKTDSLDAKALALYGFERADRLEKFTPQSKKSLELFALIQRKHDLTQMLVSEKNRYKCPNNPANIKASCNLMIETISAQIKIILGQINALIEEDLILKAKKEILKTIPGIGDIIANELLILLPELGQLNQKQIASLAGVAPRANDSGNKNGYRRTARGRSAIKPILFLASMAARKSHSHLQIFYQNLVNRGKTKMVALVALMRKIIVIANAKLKNFICTQQHS